MFVRVISAFELLFPKFRTTSTVALAKKSSDKLEAREAEDKEFAKWNELYPSRNFFFFYHKLKDHAAV